MHDIFSGHYSLASFSGAFFVRYYQLWTMRMNVKGTELLVCYCMHAFLSILRVACYLRGWAVLLAEITEARMRMA